MDQKAREVTPASAKYDLAIVGAGVVGLGAALAASRAGARVIVLEREPRVLGASVQNFGHVGVTLQQGDARTYAERSRQLWLEVCAQADIWHRSVGAVLLARADDEMALIEEVRADHDTAGMVVRGRAETLASLPVAEHAVVGSVLLRDDLQVDPRAAVPALAEVVSRLGATVRFGAHVQRVETGAVHLALETITADKVLLAVNANLDRFFPQLAAAHGVQRCMLDMVALDWRHEKPLETPLLTASSLLRYSESDSSAAIAVRDRLVEELPERRTFDINEMYTQRPDGMLIVGDTHRLGDAAAPFQPERAFDVLLELAQQTFDVPRLTVLQRWQGVYAKAAQPFLCADPLPGVRVAAVTTGIGMTTGLGFAERAITEWRDS